MPLQFVQLQSSEKMQALAPTVKEINAKFGQNKAAATAATNRLYSTTKVNPLIGCLPALVQVCACPCFVVHGGIMMNGFLCSAVFVFVCFW